MYEMELSAPERHSGAFRLTLIPTYRTMTNIIGPRRRCGGYAVLAPYIQYTTCFLVYLSMFCSLPRIKRIGNCV